jgi:hypothetical protein
LLSIREEPFEHRTKRARVGGAVSPLNMSRATSGEYGRPYQDMYGFHTQSHFYPRPTRRSSAHATLGEMSSAIDFRNIELIYEYRWSEEGGVRKVE